MCTQFCPTLCNPKDYSPPGYRGLFMKFPRQEYWSELPFPTPGDLPNSGIEPRSPALAGRFFTIGPPGKPELQWIKSKYLMTTQSSSLGSRKVNLILRANLRFRAYKSEKEGETKHMPIAQSSNSLTQHWQLLPSGLKACEHALQVSTFCLHSQSSFCWKVVTQSRPSTKTLQDPLKSHL